MKSRIIPFVCLFVLLAFFTSFAYAQNRDLTAVSLGSQIRTIFGGYTCNIFCFVAFSVIGVACVVIIYSGLTYLISRDFEEREGVKKRIIYVFVGIVFFAIMIPVVNYLTGLGSTNLSPFGCNCLNNSIEMAEPVVLGTTLPGLNVFIVTPKGPELEEGILHDFLCRGYGGAPRAISPYYDYEWTSDRDGALGFADSFKNNLSRGNHTITVKLTDSLGNSTTAQVKLSVIVPKPTP
jgi:hypothetical protein